jgi:cation transport ATPase
MNTPAANAEHNHNHETLWFGERTELYFALASGLALGAGWLLEKSASPYRSALACYIVAYLLGGYFTALEALDNPRHRRLRIESLMLVAALGAAALSAWAEGALLLFLFNLGHALENWAMGRAKGAPSRRLPSSRSFAGGGKLSRRRPWASFKSATSSLFVQTSGFRRTVLSLPAKRNQSGPDHWRKRARR